MTIPFPDRVVTIVGHQHLSGRDRTAPSLEYLLMELLDDPGVTLGTAGGAAALKKKIDDLLRTDALAVRYWRGDLNFLRRELGPHVDTVFIEYGTTLFSTQSARDHLRYQLGRVLFPALGFSEPETKDLLMTVLTPAFYAKHLRPDFKYQVRTAEPTSVEVTAYDQMFCTAPAAVVRAEDLPVSKRTERAMRRFAASLDRRGLPAEARDPLFEAITAQFASAGSASEKVSAISELFAKANFPLDALETRMLRRLIVPVDSQEIDLARMFQDLALSIQKGAGCWGRNSLIVRNMLAPAGRPALFIGGNHEAELGSLLIETCELGPAISGFPVEKRAAHLKLTAPSTN